MILKGTLNRIGGGTTDVSHTGATFIDALQVSGHPELRNICGSRYIIDHLRSAVGEPVTVGLERKVVVAVRYGGNLYKEDGPFTVMRANPGLTIAGVIVGLLLVVWSLIVGGALVAGLYFFLRQKVKAVIAQVEADTSAA